MSDNGGIFMTSPSINAERGLKLLNHGFPLSKLCEYILSELVTMQILG